MILYHGLGKEMLPPLLHMEWNLTMKFKNFILDEIPHSSTEIEPNSNFHYQMRTLQYHFFGLLEVWNSMVMKYSIGGPFLKLSSNFYNGKNQHQYWANYYYKIKLFGLQNARKYQKTVLEQNLTVYLTKRWKKLLTQQRFELRTFRSEVRRSNHSATRQQILKFENLGISTNHTIFANFNFKVDFLKGPPTEYFETTFITLRNTHINPRANNQSW